MLLAGHPFRVKAVVSSQITGHWLRPSTDGQTFSVAIAPPVSLDRVSGGSTQELVYGIAL